MDADDNKHPPNNPPQGDTTSEGGFGGDPFSDVNQRGSDKYSRGQLGQGMVEESQAPSAELDEQRNMQVANSGDSLNPYGEIPQEPFTECGTEDQGRETFENARGTAAVQDDRGRQE
ncbi:hypothetical protein DACRYDRAFT_99073 [Dacryopinax primogenitus]|uniref:Uncharacterized protein n=1 Tax=Dacryopinax primogenitus (strain DJM 731) TaxID=1858805 RepID=M5G8H8_DACPD|nr:uncharacterized protein DACRYDRAFT_99073 [Dacryopinax primogenitus]EJU04470.1 hypothetical protein DACRYDRAFT_99073 [Dacryopinax primogenitus]